MAALVRPLGGLQDKVFAAPCSRQLRCLRDIVPVHADEAILRVKPGEEGQQGGGAGRQDPCPPLPGGVGVEVPLTAPALALVVPRQQKPTSCPWKAAACSLSRSKSTTACSCGEAEGQLAHPGHPHHHHRRHHPGTPGPAHHGHPRLLAQAQPAPPDQRHPGEELPGQQLPQQRPARLPRGAQHEAGPAAAAATAARRRRHAEGAVAGRARAGSGCACLPPARPAFTGVRGGLPPAVRSTAVKRKTGVFSGLGEVARGGCRVPVPPRLTEQGAAPGDPRKTSAGVSVRPSPSVTPPGVLAVAEPTATTRPREELCALPAEAEGMRPWRDAQRGL